MKEQRILVTGGAGFIGSHVVEQLVANGHEVVVAFDKTKPGKLAHIEKKVEFIHGDIRNPYDCILAVRGVDAIIHLAALINVDHSLANPSVFYDVNTRGTVNLLEAARIGVIPSVKKFVMMSTFEVYGQTMGEPATEDKTFCDPRSPYAGSKYAAERYCLSYTASYPSPEITVIRGANVYGPRQSHDAKGAVIAIFINKAIRGEPITIFGTGEQTRDYVFVEDIARGIIDATMIRGIDGEIINLCSGVEHKISALASMIRVRTELIPAIKYIKKREGENMRSRGCPDKALKLLGWESNKDFSIELDKTIEYFREIL